MIFDNNLIFSNNQAITASAASTNNVDLQGALAINVGVGTVFGEDIGIGDGVAIPNIAAFVTTTFTAGGAATMSVAAEYAIDTGSGEPAGTPGSWNIAVQSDVIPVASLVQGAKIFPIYWPEVQLPGDVLPRYLRLYYTVATGPMLTGKVFAGLVLQRDDNIVGRYPSGFVVGP